jgi:Tol biopolymer transport system component
MQEERFETRLYFASDRNGTMNLWRVEIDEASGKVRGEPEPQMLPASWAGFLRGTPDGSRVAFQAVDRDSNLERLPFDPVGGRSSGHRSRWRDSSAA